MAFSQVIQVAGIRDAEEAGLLVDCGVDWLGFPFRLQHGREDLSEPEAAAIITGLPARSRAVLITYLDRGRDIVSLCHRLGVTTVQIHGDITLGELRAVREAVPDMTIIKSLVIGLDDRSGLDGWLSRFSPHVDAFITDTFDPSTGARGATGLVHDWRISHSVVDRSAKPVILAGGLTPHNVARAIDEVRPAGVDVHTGVEDAIGRKNEEHVRTFVAEARRAFRAYRA